MEITLGKSSVSKVPREIVECHRDLGVLIVRELKFHSHLGGVVRRAV